MLDSYVFKKLAHNDTGAAKGHQGGIVIPKEIAGFFPPLTTAGTQLAPTVDKRLTAELIVDGKRVATVTTRFQHQTWGGTRSPERRLTDNLGPLRNIASKDDFVLFAKDLMDDGFIQIKLVRQGTREHEVLNQSLGKKRWGIIDPENPPVSTKQIEEAEAFINNKTNSPASAFSDDRAHQVVRAVRRARDKAFRTKVLSQYSYRCAFTEQRFASPVSSKTVGLDAAHIVPVSANGSDHPANGLALTKDMHWAFDRGLIGVSEDRTIFVSPTVSELEGNDILRQLNGKPIGKTLSPECEALEESLEWHRSNVLIS